jgi:hypothetical protein
MPYTDEERERDLRIMAAMKKFGGSFVQALAEAARRADVLNLYKIKTTWPEYWQKYEAMADKTPAG